MSGADVTSGGGTRVRVDGVPTARLRECAGAVSGDILDRLADPAATIAATRIPAEAADDGRAEPVWAELTLGSGTPGLALAFAGAARDAARQVPRAHAYLTAGTRAVSGGSVAASGIFRGRVPWRSPCWSLTAPPAGTSPRSSGSTPTSVISYGPSCRPSRTGRCRPSGTTRWSVV